MLTAKQRKEARRRHRETNKWLESVGRPKKAIPFELMTEKERRAAENKLLRKQRDLEDKRNLDLHVKEAFGIKLPYEWMSHFIRGAGHNKHVRVIEKRELLNYPRIDGNICDRRGRRTKFKFMMFDIDSNLSREDFFRITGVMPTYFVGKLLPDGRMETPHAVVEMMYPIPLAGKDSWGELRWFERIYDIIYQRLRAADVDVDYGQKTTFKNPDFDGWDVALYGGAVLLKHIQADLDRKAALDAAFRRTIQEITGLPERKTTDEDLPRLQSRRSVHTGNYAGRNEELFHTVRLQIMAEWKILNKKEIFEHSHGLLKKLNTEKGFNLPASELKSIARSHAKFFKHYRGPSNPRRKIRNEGAAKHLILSYMTIREKQAVGAYYTHALCASRSANAVHDFKKKHPEATVSSTAKALGIDRKTARKYFYLPSPSDLAALRKIKELRESAAEFWHAKNLSSIVLGNKSGGESGLIRRKLINIEAASETVEPVNNAEKVSKSAQFSSQLVQKIRDARSKHPDLGVYNRKNQIEQRLYCSPVDTEKPEIDFLAIFT